MSGEQAVVCLGLRPDGARPERDDEALHKRDAVRRRGSGRGEEPGGGVEEIRGRAGRTAGHAAGHGMPGDEPRIRDRGERALRRRDVGDHRVASCSGEHLPHDGGSAADRDRDDDELGVGHRLRERGRRLERPARRGSFEHAAVAVEPAAARAGARRGEGDGRAHEPGADDGQAFDRARAVRARRAGAGGARRSAATSCLSTSRTAEKIDFTPRSDSGPGFAATSACSSSASRSGSIQRSPAASL